MRYATTEVWFQVAAPIDVEIRLEDVGLVWCPRMPSPFMALHQVINALEADARQDYLLQNQVIDPVRPPEVFETASFAREVGVRGNTRNQSVSFTFPVPAQYLDWELDLAATKIDFRNGTSDDYNWDEAWNWDDLENWLASIRSISRAGNDITGVAVLETTDPEMLNRGFLTFDIAMKRLTDESRVAIEHTSATGRTQPPSVKRSRCVRGSTRGCAGMNSSISTTRPTSSRRRRSRCWSSGCSRGRTPIT